MAKIVSTILGVLLGLLVGFVCIVLVEVFGALVHPFPEDMGESMEEMKEHVANFPAWAIAACIPLWAFAAFASTWTARRCGTGISHAIVGLLFIAALVMNISMLPYPIWFNGGTLVAIPLAAWFGGKLGQKSETKDSQLSADNSKRNQKVYED